MTKVQLAAIALGVSMVGACMDAEPTIAATDEYATQVCGACLLDEAPEIGEDGTIYRCEPCGDVVAETTEPIDPGVLTLDGAGTKTELACDQEYAAAVKSCRVPRDARNEQCHTKYRATVDSCYLEVNRRCGTPSDYHECVIRGRDQCRADAFHPLKLCTNANETTYQRCALTAKGTWKTCVNNAGKRLPQGSGLLRSYLPW